MDYTMIESLRYKHRHYLLYRHNLLFQKERKTYSIIKSSTVTNVYPSS